MKIGVEQTQPYYYRGKHILHQLIWQFFNEILNCGIKPKICYTKGYSTAVGYLFFSLFRQKLMDYILRGVKKFEVRMQSRSRWWW
jgi:hypothetical protein